MSNVSLRFEDTEQGGIAFRADYQSGFNPVSPAHKLANQVIKFLDEQAATKQHIVVDTAPTDNLQNGKGKLIICGNGDHL